MSSPQQQPIHVRLDGGPSDGDSAIVHEDPAALAGRVIRVLDPGGHGVLAYGPVTVEESARAVFIGGEAEGFLRPVAPDR